jgi:hypothetical protein
MYLAVFLKVPHGLGTMATTKTSTLTLYCLERMLFLVSSGWFTFPLVGCQVTFLSWPQVARRTSSNNTSASSFLYSVWLTLQMGWNWLTQDPTHATQLIIFGLWADFFFHNGKTEFHYQGNEITESKFRTITRHLREYNPPDIWSPREHMTEHTRTSY